MDVRFITPEGATEHDPSELPVLLRRDDGFTWVDMPVIDDACAATLTQTFNLHPLALEACTTRNHVPTVHAYDDHIFLVLFSPLLGRAGHVHLLELDVVVGRNFLVTTHGPLNPAVDPAEALKETDSVLRRIKEGRFRASTPTKTAYAIGSAIARRQRALIGDVAEKLPGLELEVMSSRLTEPEALLEQMFLVRHELITARTMAAQSHDIFARVLMLDRWLTEKDSVLIRDLSDQFDRVRSIADGESQFLFGVIELYQTKVHTKMTVAMERLAVIAAVTLPITAIASIVGMNVIVNDETHYLQLSIVLVVMLVMSGTLLRWARRQGWW
ncbi:MAG TPA: magnesium transporter CorA family protein [Nocardioidaceae bacterium]|nr:magnesium transporter CorA family protein [Nocardioidaceae bacterium]